MVDTAAITSMGTHITVAPPHAVRYIVCIGGAFLLARRSARLANAARAVAAAFLAAAFGFLLSTTGYVLTGGAATNRHGPVLLLMCLATASAMGLVGGIVGAAAGYWRARVAAAKLTSAVAVQPSA
jgi:hypothetical protein